MLRTSWEHFADQLCPPGERRDAIADILAQYYQFLRSEGALGGDEDNDLGEPEGDSETGCSELELLVEIRDELRQLKKEVRAMANNETLDQAVTDLGTAVSNKLAADQQLDAAEANLASDTAKVQALTAELNAETSAEQAALNPAPTPAPTPAPVPVPVPTPVTPPATTVSVPEPVTIADPTAPSGITTIAPVTPGATS